MRGALVEARAHARCDQICAPWLMIGPHTVACWPAGARAAIGGLDPEMEVLILLPSRPGLLDVHHTALKGGLSLGLRSARRLGMVCLVWILSEPKRQYVYRKWKTMTFASNHGVIRKVHALGVGPLY